MYGDVCTLFIQPGYTVGTAPCSSWAHSVTGILLNTKKTSGRQKKTKLISIMHKVGYVLIVKQLTCVCLQDVVLFICP